MGKVTRLNKRAFETLGFTVEEYKRWCTKYKKPIYMMETEREFCTNVIVGLIYKTKRTNQTFMNGDEF